MANPYILGQIANPQMADIAGALDYRQKKMQEDEARRKEIKFQQIAGKALSTGLKEGSILHELAMNDPARYLVVAKSLGVDPSNGAEGMSVMDDISSIYGQTVQGVENGLGYVESLIQSRNELGLDTSRLQALLEQGKENPTIFKNTIDLMQKTFNPNKSNIPAELQEFESMTSGLSEEEKQKAKRISLGLDPRAQGSADITTATTGLTDVVAESKGKIAGTVKGSETTSKENVNRAQDFINRGVAAAEGMPTVNRGIELLELVETGGYDRAKIAAKQALGIESADEGELTYNLGKSVLTQLRETFGSAFTENEGQRLANLEAGLSRSPATNKRILAQVKQIMEAKAKRGREAAIEQGDDFTAKDIDDFMGMSLSPQGGSGKGAMTPSIQQYQPNTFKSKSGIQFQVK